ncbi:hypothetical protein [Halobellus salinisoli]|uniref:hypothetical protein n=1 Tax=Halobellus salinisoli TaxID=3108500 RepID=UPI003008EB92
MASRSDTAADANAPTESAADALARASFVRVVSAADGDSLSAAGLLARGLRSVDVPFHVRVASLGADAPAADDGVLAAVGSTLPNADVTIAPDGEPASLRAYEIARTLGRDVPNDIGDPSPGLDVDPTLALAGVVAAGDHPASTAGALVESAVDSGALVRRSGVAVPVDDVVDGLTHSTLVHAPFSGDGDAVAAELAAVFDGVDDESAHDEETRRSIASLVALAVAGDDAATPRAATAVERVLRPYATPEAPTATLGGFADVLNAVAGERPGVGVALAIGHRGRDAAVDAWRTHGTAVHRALHDAHIARYDGVFAVRSDVRAESESASDSAVAARLQTVARLARDFRSPEPLVVALGDGVAAVSAIDSGAAAAASALASEFGSDAADWTGNGTRAIARFDPAAEEADVIAAIREAVR